MEAFYFYVNVLPLGVLVVALTIVTLYYARREERAQKKLKKLVDLYAKKKSKLQESYDAQMERLQELLKAESIDNVTFERMKNALEKESKKHEAGLTAPSTPSPENIIEKQT